MRVVRLSRYTWEAFGRVLATWQDYDMPVWRAIVRRIFGLHRGRDVNELFGPLK